jgi:hypothetical protein
MPQDSYFDHAARAHVERKRWVGSAELLTAADTVAREYGDCAPLVQDMRGRAEVRELIEFVAESLRRKD